jgi:hypothetical protein
METQILAWADAHHDRTGKWPSHRSVLVSDVVDETWSGIDTALRLGYCGFPGGDTLARLLDRHRRGKVSRRFVWTPEEDEWVRTQTAQEAAQKTGHSLRAVYERRRRLGVITARGGPVPRGWTPAEDELVQTLAAQEAARRTKRSLAAIYVRRHQLGVRRH